MNSQNDKRIQKNVRLDTEEDLNKYYSINEHKIGKGAFGVVFKAHSIKGKAQKCYENCIIRTAGLVKYRI